MPQGGVSNRVVSHRSTLQTMKFVKLLLILTVGGLALSACDLLDQRNRKFDDSPKLEFKPLNTTIDEGDVEAAGGSTTITTDIQLIGRQRDSDLSISFSAADSSTAVEGTHYNLPSTSVTIPANSSSTEVSVELLDNSADDGGTNHVLYLVLQDASGVEAAENLKTFTVTYRGEDE